MAARRTEGKGPWIPQRGDVMVGVDKVPKEREGSIRDAGCEKGDGETRRTFDHYHHPLVTLFLLLFPYVLFSLLFGLSVRSRCFPAGFG